MRHPATSLRSERRRPERLPGFLLALLLLPVFASHGGAQEVARTLDDGVYALPPAVVRDFFSRDPGFPQLDRVSPDGRYAIATGFTELSSLERMAERTLRLAELELRPASDRLWHLDTYGAHALRILDIETGEWREVELPEGSFLSDLTWSPGGDRLAFLLHLPGKTEVWTADAGSGNASRLSDARIMATAAASSPTERPTPSRMLQWTPRGTVISLMVPEDRGAEPVRPAVPSSPIIRRTRPEEARTRTLPNLLEDAHDVALFIHYTESVPVELGVGRPRILGEAGIYTSLSLSPEGSHLLATRIEPPFSYITSWSSFPRVTEVLDVASGDRLALVQRTLLREGDFSDPEGDSVGVDRRMIAWRPDGAGLAWVERASRNGSESGAGDAAPAEEGRGGSGGERVVLLPPPFDLSQLQTVFRSPDPIRSVAYDAGARHAFTTVTRGARTGVLAWDLRQDSPEPTVIVDFHSTADPTDLRGSLWTVRDGNGIESALLSSDGGAVFLSGPGYAEDHRPAPFVDRIPIGGGDPIRVFEGAKTTFDQPLVALDPDFRRMIVARESLTQLPDSWLREEGGVWRNLTRNTDPFPETTAARRIDFEFERRDGVKVPGRVSLPVQYREGEKVPAIFWTYPREYISVEEYERALLRSRNLNLFPRMAWLRWSDIWLTQGYALVYPEIPIIGENYNDTYIASMVDAMHGAIRAVDALDVVDIDRIGHGGHSYGAFATANLLAHTPFFRAGIAGHGAYNRTLTPNGFQAERRLLWEAPHTYIAMSPFMNAHLINTPILFYHGGDDNNTGTWPMQSRRMIQALTGLGKEAVLFEYPFESHTPRALENNLDMWARWIHWFDRWVKDPGGSEGTATSAIVGDAGGR